MWNAGGDNNEDLAKQMSSALNVKADCLQQFMSGNISVETLAAMKPFNSGPSESRPNQISGNAPSWTNVPETSLLPSTSYESSPFNSMLSGSAQAMLPPPPLAIPTVTHSDSPFRSPPFTSDPSNLMELSTVTPSRIKNSPATILSKATPGIEMDVSSIASSSTQNPYPLSSASFIHNSALQQDERSSTNTASDTDDQFKIVIGQNLSSDEASTSNFFVNLDSLQTPSEQEVEYDETLGAPAVISDTVEVDESTEASTSQNDDDENAGNGGVTVKKRRRQVLSKMPKTLRGLMGEANLAFARGALEEALKMCMEIVRQAPYAAEPYDTLAMIYEEKGESVRSLQYSLLAAHLSKTSANQWINLAGMCLNQGDLEKAVDCYSRAAKSRPADYKIQIECGKLCLKLSNLQKAVVFYKSAVMLMPAEEGKDAVEIARNLTKMCHSQSQNNLGISLLEQAFESHPSYCKDEDANLLCELYLMERQCAEVFRVLAKHSNVEVEYVNGDITKIKASELMAVDLLCKVAIAAIQLEKYDLVQDIVTTVCAHDPADTGDIQFELAEAYFVAEKYPEALVILDPLVASRNYSLAAVWLKHGECHKVLHNWESALTSYKNCVRLAPGHAYAHLQYSKCARKLEKFSLASQTLDVAENYELDPEDHIRIYYERFKVFKAWSERSKKKKSSLSVAGDAALLIFVNKFKTAAFKEARVYLVPRKRASSNPMAGELKLIQLRHVRLADQKDYANSDLYLRTVEDIFISKDKWMKFFDKTISVLLRCHRYKDALYLSEGMQWYARWYEHLSTRKHFERTSFCACIYDKNFQRAYSILSTWLRLDLDCNALWNIFNQLIGKTGNQRHQKFCLRLLIKNPENTPLMVVTAHNWMTSGFYKTAVGEYMVAHKKVPNEPLYLFMTGVAFINLCSQKFTDFKHSFVTQALSYFERYHKLRGLDQEYFYNVGRSMHQLGLEHFAIHYYEKALECKLPLIEGSHNDEDFELSREIAFNLSLIYRQSGNHASANEVLVKYCTI